MKKSYTKTEWKNGETRINAKNMNNIESGISDLYDNAISSDELEQGLGINIEKEDSLKFGLNIQVINENETTGITYDPNTIYILVNIDEKFNGIVINGREIRVS